MSSTPIWLWVDEVIFRAAGGVYVVEAYKYGNDIVADVPNKMLEDALTMVVDLGQGAKHHPECRTRFDMVPAEKPADYVAVENIPAPIRACHLCAVVGIRWICGTGDAVPQRSGRPAGNAADLHRTSKQKEEDCNKVVKPC